MSASAADQIRKRIAAAYAFTTVDKTALTDLLAKAYLAAKVAAYQKAVATTDGVLHLHTPWTPAARDAAAARTWATKQMASIAGTWAETIGQLTDRVAAESADTSGNADVSLDEGLIGGLLNAAAIGAGVAGGVKAFIAWKAPQIASVATGTGTNDGTAQWVSDVLADEASGDPNGVRVRVVPETSNSDECADYAGNDYSLDDAADLPDFPLHPNCKHSTEVYTV